MEPPEYDAGVITTQNTTFGPTMEADILQHQPPEHRPSIFRLVQNDSKTMSKDGREKCSMLKFLGHHRGCSEVYKYDRNYDQR